MQEVGVNADNAERVIEFISSQVPGMMPTRMEGLLDPALWQHVRFETNTQGEVNVWEFTDHPNGIHSTMEHHVGIEGVDELTGEHFIEHEFFQGEIRVGDNTYSLRGTMPAAKPAKPKAAPVDDYQQWGTW